MSGRFLLDTNVVIAIFARDSSVLQYVGEADEVFLPAIVVGELHYGAQKSARVEENVERIIELASETTVLACDADTARHYGTIKNRLRAKGKPIPENDIWIAAVALQHGLELASRDPHFKEIEDLSLVVW
jgi:tRNA(fMet)-specific endonuclease VapC